MDPQSNVRWVELHYTDVTGLLHSVFIRYSQYSKNQKIGFGKVDGSSVGFTEIHESDLRLIPDDSTFRILPWDSQRARAICDVYEADKRLDKDPRFIAERADMYVSSEGFKVKLGVEMEFFLFKSMKFEVAPYKQVLSIESDEAPPYGVIKMKGGYHITEPLDTVTKFRLEVANILINEFNVNVTSHHHEVASAAQIEISVTNNGAKLLGDDIQTLKYVSRIIASNHGMIANFMPKPIAGDNGSGMHIHVSLWSNGQNLFFDPDDRYAHISQLARYFIGGLIEHGRALSALVAPTTNSYKRLIPGFEAPVYLVWSKANRSAAIRIPAYYNNNPLTHRIEFRPPDPSANPYLALAAIIMAGLDGIKKKIDPGDPINTNVYELSERAIKEMKIKTLPPSLSEALLELESDYEFLKPVFTESAIQHFIELKRKEIKFLNQYPTPAEFMYYFML